MTQFTSQSRTAKLWILYLKYIGVVKKFIFAERTCNWQMHLNAISEMLNLFAATSHKNYAKCARLYLQEMEQLPEKYPWLHKQFMEGRHAISRTGNTWTSIWSDLCIEQTLMRAIKALGGLTRGRGFSECVQILWVLSMSCSTEIDAAMKEFTGLDRLEVEHNELGFTRRERDEHAWLKARNPFLIESYNLHSLSTGLVSEKGKDDVNCEDAEEIGQKIQECFDNTSVYEFSLKRKDVLQPISSLLKVSSEKKSGKSIVDNTKMFIRLVAVGDRVDSLESIFYNELTTEPMSLFKSGTMRKTNKSALLKCLLGDDSLVCDEP